MTFYVYCGRLL